MYDYGRLVFLDNQKTGSTFVSKFLETCCTLDRVKHPKGMKHVPVRSFYDKENTYFATVREPFALYSSLFRYGVDQKGSTWKGLKKRKLLHLYESFPDWLEFVLDDKNAAIFDTQFGKFAHLGVGLMSYRAMRITVPWPQKAFHGVETYDALIKRWEKRQISNYIFKQENLNESLRDFAQNTVPDFFDMDKVNAFLDAPQEVNVTGVRAKLEFPEDLRQEIARKERFLLEKFYT